MVSTGHSRTLATIVGLDLIASFMLDLVKEREAEVKPWIEQEDDQAVDKLGISLRADPLACRFAEARRVILPAFISCGVDVGQPPNRDSI